MGAEIVGGDEYSGDTIASTFLSEMGRQLPQAIFGDYWEY
jgi:hypothetical protein